MRVELDKTDLEILRLMQEDGRITNAELARRVGLSPPSILQRVRKLEERGCIRGYQAVLNGEMLGYDLLIMVQVSLGLHGDKPVDAFRQAIEGVPEVLECLHVSGDYDFLLRIAAQDMNHYERIVREKLSTLPSLGKIQSCFVLSVVKENEGLPLGT